MSALWLLFAGLAAGGEFRPDAQPGHPTRALLLGGSGSGHWNVGTSVGSPWATASLHRGLAHGWTALAEVQSAALARTQPAVGVGQRWVDRRWRVSGEGWMGWTLQGDPVPFRGPAGELRVKAGRATGRLVPYVHLGTRLSRTEDRVEDPAGALLRSEARWEGTLTGALGTGVLLGDRVGLDIGLDLPWVDVPDPSIPGIHIGLQTGFGRSP